MVRHFLILPFTQIALPLSIYFLFFIPFCQAQIKYEKEYRLHPSKVPVEACEFIQALEIQHKIKWYFEENIKSNSIEAKFKKDNLMYSVEFDSLGQLEDVEVVQSWNSIPLEVQKCIETYLKQQFKKYKIRKIQFQYIGKPKNMSDLIKLYKHKDEIPYTLNFEIILKGKTQKNVSLYEMLFDENGSHLNTDRIVLRNTDNLEF